MVVVQEFDLDIKPAKLVKGQWLCKLVVEAQDKENEDPRWENELALWCGEASYVSLGQDSWYEKLTYLLHHGTCLENLNPTERRSLRLCWVCVIFFACVCVWVRQIRQLRLTIAVFAIFSGFCYF
jgi:hypothetical protein